MEGASSFSTGNRCEEGSSLFIVDPTGSIINLGVHADSTTAGDEVDEVDEVDEMGEGS